MEEMKAEATELQNAFIFSLLFHTGIQAEARFHRVLAQDRGGTLQMDCVC